ncbi:pyocin knob domain-containing protein [Pseudomonas sp. LP_7_YM]|uniref:pyocin knob domain-containing protein n=1 Tax=Pseudomonas sp. LP_7_YM TaxID=2485137 RepID=UPI00105F1BCD|nr:pyocin knob domain-containing protein [Pseudomonas sp. LP_7_YM]TDV61253.1 hypothetical protein EC915_10940 [Pseudomonas sp. LP_7_YM]
MTRPASYNRVWAEDAAADQMGGESATADQSVIEEGWVGSATAEPPTARMQNYWQIRVDLGLQELERQGCLSWRGDVAYRAGAFVFYASNLFQAISANTGITPQGAGDVGIWSLLRPGQWPTTVDHVSGVMPILKGGTGSNTAPGALSNLGAAPIDSPSLAGTPRAPTQTAGDSSTLLATDAFVQTAVNGMVNVNIAGSAATTLTQAQYGMAIISLTGALTADKSVIFPAISGHWQVINTTTGAFTVTLKTANGNGVTVTRGTTTNIFCDGSNISLQQTDFISPVLTGTPQAPTAAVGTNSNQVATMMSILQGMAAFGLGAVNGPQVTDLNAVSNGGMYFAISTALNLPISANSSLIHIPYSDGSAALQICCALSPPVRICYRTKSSGSWNAWKEFSMLDSPSFTGDPKAPTAAVGDNDLSIANTSFVQSALATFGVGTLLGPLPPSNDLNLATNGGFYRTTSATLNTPASSNLSVMTAPYNNGGCLQICAILAGGSVDTVRIFYRSQAGGTWSSWREFAALNSPAMTGKPTAPDLTRFAVGDALVNANTLKAAGVQANNFRNIALSGATVSLVSADAGSIIGITGSGGGTLILPAASSVTAGALIGLRANNSLASSNIIKGNGSDTIGGSAGAGGNTAVLATNDSIMLVSDGVSKWDVAAEATAAFIAQQFTVGQQLTANGFQKLPGGLIIQWGAATTNASGVLLVSMPISFSAPPKSIVGALAISAASNVSLGFNIVSNGSFRAYTTSGSSGSPGVAASLAFNWIAIGT